MRAAVRSLVTLPLLLSAAACGQAPHDGPNVVIVVLDTLRPDRLGCYGNERATSPNIDAIAAGSFLFEQAQSPAPWTAPSLISLMTSVYPQVHGVHGFPVPGRLGEGITTLAEVLSAAGYRTAAFTEGGYAKGEFGLDRGFDVYPENPGDDESYTSNLSHPSRLAANVDRTIEWLREDRREPFLLFFHTYEVHSPPRPPEDDVRAFRPDFHHSAEETAVRAAIDAWNERRELDADGARAMRRYAFLSGRHMGFDRMPVVEDRTALTERAAAVGVPLDFDAATESPEDMAWVRDLYDAEVRYTDREIGRLWRVLEEEGLLEDTIFVFTSDHGEALGEHARVGHGHELHEEVLRVLLLLRLPALERLGGPLPPRRIEQLVRTVDVMPTLLELTGVPTGGLVVQGRSLVPLLRGELDEQPAFSHALMDADEGDQRHTIRTARWRLIADRVQGTAQLFDLEADPGATRDVAAQHPDVVEELAALLAAQDRRDEALREALGDVGTTAVDPDSDLLKDLRGLGYAGEN